MVMIQIEDEEKLLEELFKQMQIINDENVVFLGGHFPIRINPKTREMYEDFEVWGSFSLYTLKLSVKVAVYAKSLGKKVSFLFLCDDNTYRDEGGEILSGLRGLTDSQKDNLWRSKRIGFYKSMSGNKRSFPLAVKEVLAEGGFSEKDVIEQNQEKDGRNNCLYFSEVVLRNPKNIGEKSTTNIDACSREYVALVENELFLYKKIRSYLVGFIPYKCSHFICDAVDFLVSDFRGINIFMETVGKPNKKKIYTSKNKVLLKIN
jgi:hypothetical protein